MCNTSVHNNMKYEYHLVYRISKNIVDEDENAAGRRKAARGWQRLGASYRYYYRARGGFLVSQANPQLRTVEDSHRFLIGINFAKSVTSRAKALIETRECEGNFNLSIVRVRTRWPRATRNPEVFRSRRYLGRHLLSNELLLFQLHDSYTNDYWQLRLFFISFTH